MAQQDALSFISKVSSDAGLQKQLANAKPEEWVAAAKKAGITVTADELKSASKAIYGKAKGSGQISDEALSGVVGGTLGQTTSQLTYQGLSFNTSQLSIPSFKLMAW